ncbi:hypothetical protein AB0C87_20110 [Actinomadura sp. NPDC048021]|uniref:hypothetical protein n=1 Tax=Actinomadura sp. NPDC048021 TaxID=3155385 RepID=UPI0033F24372
MKKVAWNRQARITEVRDRIWAYISPAAQMEGPGLLVAAALLDWPEDEASRLGHLQFLLCDEVGAFLADMPQQLRRLSTSSTRDEKTTTERIEGPVNWSRTQALRGTSGNQSSFVTSPAKREYQTPENEILVHVLDTIVETAALTAWATKVERKGLALLIRKRVTQAAKFRQHKIFTSIEPRRPSARAVASIRSGRTGTRYAAAIAAYDKAVRLVEQIDRQAIRESIEQAGIVTSLESTLFELLTTFRVMDALQLHGWKMDPFYTFKGAVQSQGFRRDGRQVRLWYQSCPDELEKNDRYTGVLGAHKFESKAPLRPDVVLKWCDQSNADRWLLIECKLSQSGGVGRAARDALSDLLFYRRSFDHVLGGSGEPYGVGVAWGKGLQPATDTEVVLCTPDTLATAIGKIVI